MSSHGKNRAIRFVASAPSVRDSDLSKLSFPTERSEVEGPAVLSVGHRMHNGRIALPLCHPERSRGICSSADHSWECISTERSREPALREVEWGSAVLSTSIESQRKKDLSRRTGTTLSTSLSHSQAQSYKFKRPAFKFNVSLMDGHFLTRLLQQIGNPCLLNRQFNVQPYPASLALCFVSPKNEFVAVLRLFECGHLEIAALG